MPLFRKEADIIPSGATHGLDPIKGLQERNQQNLLQIFSAATPVLEELAKVKPSTWRSMTGLFTALEKTFGTTVKKIGEGLLTPRNIAKNRFMNTMEGYLAPVMVGLNDITNRVEAWAIQNQTGAAVGGGLGTIAGYILPGSPLLWGMFGSLYGGLWQQFLNSPEWTDEEGNAIPQLIPDYIEPFGPLPDIDPIYQEAATNLPVPDRVLPYLNEAGIVGQFGYIPYYYGGQRPQT